MIQSMKILQLSAFSLCLCLAAAGCRTVPAPTDPEDVTVTVFSVNDFHGAFVADGRKGIPGAPALWQTLDSLRRVYPNHITVSAGDNFGGSYFYQSTHGVLLPVLFDGLGIRLSAIGNHEFDDGQEALAAKWAGTPLRPAGWDLDYVCANVRDSSGRVPSFARPVATQSVRLTDGREVNVAFVGLLTSTTPLQASRSKLKGLSFDGRYDRVLDSVKALPEFQAARAAQIRLLLLHVGTRTENGAPSWDDPEGARLSQLRDTTWHGALTGHTHQPVCGRIGAARIPAVQGQWHGNYVGILKFRLDGRTLRVKDVEPQLCPVRPLTTLGPGAQRMQALTDSLLRHTTTPGGTPLGQRLTSSPRTLVHDRDDKWRQTAMGSLVCEAYAEAYRKAAGLGPDAVIIGTSHFGSIRAGFSKGDVTVLDVGEALPFANALRVYRLTGRQLRDLVEFGLHNRRYGWLQTGWLAAERDAAGHVASLAYTGPSGQSVPLHDDTPCLLVTDEFITTGGDGYPPALFPAAQETHVEGLPATTDAFIQYLQTFKTLPLDRLRAGAQP